jgi:hypothetical protein
MHTATVIAPPDTVDDVREAGGDTLGDGRQLAGGGVAWDLYLSERLKEDAMAAGAEVHLRDSGHTMTPIIDNAGYTLQAQALT